jgi:hypothetical protein
MGKLVTIYKKTDGLNNVDAPIRVPFNAETGVVDLTEAYNVDVDSSGRLSRRKGFTATGRTESSRDIFCDGGECLYVSGTALYRLNPDYSRTGVRSGLTADKQMYYVQVGDRIYYSNGVERGYVVNGVSSVWQVSAYVGPATFRVFSSPPYGTILAFHSSRLYMVVDSVLWYSEPFAYNWWDMARNFIPFSYDIRMVRAVKDGLYVGDERGVYFLQGTSPKEFNFISVSDSPMVKGTDVSISGLDVKDDAIYNKVAVWTGQDGICLGLPGGDVKNLTKNKVTYPSSQLGAAAVLKDKYLTLLQ